MAKFSTVLGAICGDFIGSRFEYNNHLSKKFELLHKDCCFTDDTYLTISVMDSLLTAHKLGCMDDKEKLQEIVRYNFKKYVNLYPDGSYGGHFFLWALSDAKEPYGSWGNGALMRVSPCIYAKRPLKAVCELAGWVTDVTHDSNQALEAISRYMACIWANAYLRRHFETWGRCLSNYPLPTLNDIYEKKFKLDTSCESTLKAAITCCLESRYDFEDIMRTCVSIGGDTDTICCVAGGLCGRSTGIDEPIVDYVLKKLKERDSRLFDTFVEFSNTKFF